MKNIFILIVLLMNTLICNAQIAIGKSMVDGSGIVDFGAESKGGIVLPVISELPTGNSAKNGTIIVNATNPLEIKIQARQNDTWIDLTQPINLPNLIINYEQDISNGVVIGSETSDANGVLVLESNDKALILPKVTSVLDIKNNVKIGTMLYDLSKKSLAIYNGEIWVFWN